MIDFHCHLDLYPDPRRAVRECAAHDIEVLSVTTTPSAWRGTRALAEASPRIHTALGLHPQLAHQRRSELALFTEFLSEAAYVGEVGLDGSPELSGHWHDQLVVFTTILAECRRAGGRVLSIHSRRAATAVLDVLCEHRDAGVPVLHWFSGSQRELARAIDLGCWFSVGPAMLSGDRGRGLIQRMPKDRVLTESDGPFAQVDGRAAQPWDVQRAVDGLTSVWQESSESVAAILDDNLTRIISSGGMLR